jgi:hypothetical protein
MSSVFAVAIVAGLDRTHLGSYLVPIILLIAVPSSALLTSFTLYPKRENEIDENERIKKGGENFSKSFLSLLGKGESIEVDIVPNQNMYMTSVPISNFNPTITNEKYCSSAPEARLGKNKEKKECDTINNVKNIENVKDVNDMKDKSEVRGGNDLNNCGEMTSQAGNICPCGLGSSEDVTSAPETTDFMSLSINGKEENANKSNINETKGESNAENTIEIDLIPSNSLPLISTWPDYPLLVRRGPSSSSREVSQCKEKFMEYIRPIKIHSNVEAMRAICELYLNSTHPLYCTYCTVLHCAVSYVVLCCVTLFCATLCCAALLWFLTVFYFEFYLDYDIRHMVVCNVHVFVYVCNL